MYILSEIFCWSCWHFRNCIRIFAAQSILYFVWLKRNYCWHKSMKPLKEWNLYLLLFVPSKYHTPSPEFFVTPNRKWGFILLYLNRKPLIHYCLLEIRLFQGNFILYLQKSCNYIISTSSYVCELLQHFWWSIRVTTVMGRPCHTDQTIQTHVKCFETSLGKPSK